MSIREIFVTISVMTNKSIRVTINKNLIVISLIIFWCGKIFFWRAVVKTLKRPVK